MTGQRGPDHHSQVYIIQKVPETVVHMKLDDRYKVIGTRKFNQQDGKIENNVIQQT